MYCHYTISIYTPCYGNDVICHGTTFSFNGILALLGRDK